MLFMHGANIKIINHRVLLCKKRLYHMPYDKEISMLNNIRN